MKATNSSSKLTRINSKVSGNVVMSSKEEMKAIDESLSAERYRSRIRTYLNQDRRIQHELQRVEREHGEHRIDPEFHESASRAAP